MPTLKTFSLYGTTACHLCELAEQMIQQQLDAGCLCRVECVDIAESDALFQRYGTNIPVLRHPDGREINWPFDALELENFLRS